MTDAEDASASTTSRTAAGDSLALMTSAVGTGIATFILWTVVARLTDPATVGTASAAVSAISFLGGIGSLSLTEVLTRYLPVSGAYGRRVIISAYAGVLIVSAVLGTAFLLTPWGAEVDGGLSPPVFIALVALAALFLALDGALIGFDRASLVALKNLTVGALRNLLLPVALLVSEGAVAVLGAWGLATLLGVGAVAVAVGRHAAVAEGDIRLPSRAFLAKFVALQTATATVNAALFTFLPALVTLVLGATAGGYFYVPWLAAGTTSLLFMKMFISAVRQTVADPTSASTVFRGQFRLGGLLVAVIMLGCVPFPRLPLLVLGPDFADHAAGLLRWIGLSVPGTALGLTFWAVCMIRERPWPILAINAAMAGGTVGGLLLLGPAGLDTGIGITAVGAIFCGVQWVIGLAVTPALIRSFRRIMSSSADEHETGLAR